MEILKVYTPEQLYNIMKNKMIADGVSLSNFNEGAAIRSLMESVALITSTTGIDYLLAIKKAIQTAMYDGFGFTKNSELKTAGYIRFFRLPALTIQYSGSGTSATISITTTTLTLEVDTVNVLTLDLTDSAYDKVSEVALAIDGVGDFTATLINEGPSADLYKYTGKEIIGETDHRGNDGFACMDINASLITITSGQIFSIDESYQTVAAGSIAAGAASSEQIAIQALVAGSASDIAAGELDTMEGKGNLDTPIAGVEHIINDVSFTGGADEETDAEREERFSEYIRGLAVGTEQGIKAAVLNITGIRSCTIRESYPEPGYNTIIADDGTGVLSAELIAEIEKVMNGDPDDITNYPGKRTCGIPVFVTAPSVTSQSVIMTVYRTSLIYDETEIENAVQAAVEKYINTLTLGQDIIITEIIKVAKNSHPAVYDVLVTTPAANVTISENSVARTTSVSVLVSLVS